MTSAVGPSMKTYTQHVYPAAVVINTGNPSMCEAKLSCQDAADRKSSSTLCQSGEVTKKVLQVRQGRCFPHPVE